MQDKLQTILKDITHLYVIYKRGNIIKKYI